MSTSDIAQKSGTLPLERKNNPASIPDNPEIIEAKDRVGFFDQNLEVFDATRGSINFNLDTVVPSSTVSDMFARSNEWISITPSNVADKIVSAASTVIKAAGDLASDTIEAGSDLLDQLRLQPNSNEVASKIDPVVAAKKQEEENKMAEYSANRKREESIEAEKSNICRKLDDQARLTPLRQKTSALVGLPQWIPDMVSESGEVRSDLEPIAERKSEELRKAKERQIEEASSAKGPSKHGAEGPGMINEDNKSGERQGFTAQTATG